MKWSIRSLRLFMISRHGAEAANELFHNMQVSPMRPMQAYECRFNLPF